MATAKHTKTPATTESAPREKPSAAEQEILEQKSDVRRAIIECRQELRPSARSTKSREICNKLLDQLRASGIKGKNGQPPTLAVYAALRYEVDLDRFIRGAYAYGYRIVFPCMIPNAAQGAMCMRSVSCNNYLGGNVPFIVDPRKPWGPAVTEEHQTYTSTRAGATRRFIPSRIKGSVPPQGRHALPGCTPIGNRFGHCARRRI